MTSMWSDMKPIGPAPLCRPRLREAASRSLTSGSSHAAAAARDARAVDQLGSSACDGGPPRRSPRAATRVPVDVRACRCGVRPRGGGHSDRDGVGDEEQPSPVRVVAA